MRYALVPRFHLELALMKMVHATRLVSLEALLSELRGATSPGKSSSASPRPTSAPSPRLVPDPPRSPGSEGLAKPLATESGPAAMAVPLPAAPGETPTPVAPSHDAVLDTIKAKVYGQSNFLGSCLEHMTSWRLENGEATFFYAQKESFFADLLKSREQQEVLRAVCAEVLGQPVKICVRLTEQEVEARGERPNARQRAERDQTVEAFRKKFNGAVLDVKDLSGE